MRHSRRFVIFLVFSFLLSLAATAAPGRYIDAEIEVFEGWGFLGWGSWDVANEQLIRLQITPHTEDDQALIERWAAGCTSGSEICGLLADLRYRFDRLFSIVPDVGAAYRVRLTNKTDATLGIVLSIDGLNSNGGSATQGSAADKKWVLRPQQAVTIAGWQITDAEALQFRFDTPSQSLSTVNAERGEIAVYVYLPSPEEEGARGTSAGELIDQPTVHIPFEAATEQATEVIRFRYTRDRVALGILCEEIDGVGIRINRVVEGTIAELKGLRAGDIITVANGQPISTCSDLQEVLASKQPGDRLVLKVHRSGAAFLLTLELEE